MARDKSTKSQLIIFEQFLRSNDLQYNFENVKSAQNDVVKFKLTVGNIVVYGSGLNDDRAKDECVKEYISQQFNLRDIFVEGDDDYKQRLTVLPDEIKRIIENYQNDNNNCSGQKSRYLKLSDIVRFKFPPSETLNKFRNELANNDPYYRAEATIETYRLLSKIVSEMKLSLREKVLNDENFRSMFMNAHQVFSTKKSTTSYYFVGLSIDLNIDCSAIGMGRTLEEARCKAAVDLLSAIYVGSIELTDKMMKLAEEYDQVLSEENDDDITKDVHKLQINKLINK